MANGNNDTRIVEMQFDNKDFEKNIAKSQKSLEKFKKELNFEEASRGMDKFSKSVKDADGFDSLANNIQKLTDKFTGLGKASEFVMSRVRRSLESMGDKVISFTQSLTTVQQQAGFVKYESLNKAVQTLKSATGKEEQEIYGVLDRLTKYTDETSYDFSQGVTSISQLVSSGAATLGKAEKVVEGFYNYAAKAGADTQTAAHALQYSMVQALQRGYLDWSNAKELSSKSLLTSDFKEQLLETAVALGTVTKEGDKYYAISKKNKKQKKVEINTTNLFNDSLQHQWATTKVLNATLEKYGDTSTDFGKQAYAAAQRCTTFTDALNAWKDMLATGWMTTYRTVFGDLGDAMQLFSGICNKVSDALSGLVDARNKVLKSWKGMGGKDSLWGMLVGEFESPDQGTFFEGRKGLLDLIIGTGDMIQDAFWDMVKDSMSEADRSQLELWAGNTEAVMALMKSEGILDGATEEELEQLRQYIDENFGERSVLQAYLGSKLAEATKGVQDFVQSVSDWFNVVDESTGETRGQKIKAVFEAVFNTVRFIGEILGGVFDFFGEILGEGQLGEGIDAIITFFGKLGNSITDAENDVSKSGGITAFFHNLAEALKPITSFLSGAVIQITDFFTTLLTGSEGAEKETNIWDKITEFFQILGNILSNIGQPIIDTIIGIFNALTGGEKKTEDGKEHISFFQTLFDILLKVSEVAGKVIGFVGKLISGFITWGKESGFFAETWERIKTVLKVVWDTIKLIGAPFKKFFGTMSETLQDLFSNGFNAESLARAKEKLKESLSDLFGNLGGVINTLREKIRNFFKKIFSLFKTEAEDGAEGNNLFKNVITTIKKSFGKIPEELNKLASAFKKSEGVTTFFDAILIVLDELKQLFVKFRDAFGFTNTEAALAIATIVGVVVLIFKIVKAVRRLGEGMSSLGSALKKFSLFGNSGGTETPGDKLLKTAIALGIIAAAVVVLGNMPWEKALQGLVAMGAIMVGMGLFVKSMSKSIKNLDWKAAGMMALAMISLGIAVNKMIPAMKMLGEMNIDQYRQTLYGLVVILTAIGTFFYAVGKLDINFKKLSGILPLAIGIWLMVKTLSKVADMPLDKLETMGKSLVVVMGSLALVGAAVRKAPKNTFRQMALMIASISLLTHSLKTLSNVKDEEYKQILKGYVGLIAGLLVLAGGIAMINKYIGKGEGAGMQELAFAIAAMAILVFALKPLADMSDSQLGKMGSSFGVLISGLLVLAGGLALINKKTLGIGDMGLKSLLWAALGMFAIIMALKPVADMEWGQLGKMGATFGVIIAGLLVLVGGLRLIQSKFGGGMKKSISFGAIIALVLGIAALIAILRPIANMKWEELGKMGAAFAVLIAGIATAVGVMQGTAGKFSQAVGTALVLAAVVGAISRIIKLLMPFAGMDTGGLIKMGLVFTVLIRGLTRAVSAIQKTSVNFGQALSSVLMLVSVVSGMYALVQILQPMADMSWNKLAKIGLSMIVLITGLTNSVKALQKNPTNFASALGSVLTIAGIVGGLYFLIEALKPLVGLSWGELAKIGVGFAVLIIGLTKATKSLMKMSNESDGTGFKGVLKTLLMMGGLAAAMYVLSPSLVKVKNVKLGTIIGFTAGLSILMLAMAKSSAMMSKANPKGVLLSLLALVGGLAGIMAVVALIGPWMLDSLSASLPGFGESLKTLGESIKSFGESISGLSASNVDTALGLIHGIAQVQLALTGENISLAVFSALTGQDIKKGDLQAFGKDMAVVGGFVAEFCEAIKDSDFSNVEAATSALTAIAGVQDTLTNQNIKLAVFSKLTGQNIEAGSMTAFAEDIKAIAPMVKEVGDTFKDTDFSNFGKAAEALQAIGKVQNMLTNENIKLAVFSALTGQNIQAGDMVSFGEDIKAVAPMVKEVGDTFKDTDFSNFEKASEALLAIGKVQNMLTGENIKLAVFSKLTGQGIDKGNMVAFGEDIKAIAPMVKDVGDAFQDTDFSNFSKAADALLAIGKVQNMLTGENIEIAVFSALTGQNIQAGDMKGFADDVITIAPELARISEKLEGTDFTNVAKAGDALKAFAEVQKVLTDADIQAGLANMVLDIFGSDNTIEPKDLEDFGNDIVPLGEAMAKFAKSVSYVEMEEGKIESIDTEGFKAAIEAIEVLGSLQKELPNVGSLFDWLTGHQQTLPEFASGLGYLGAGIRNIYEEVYKVREGNVPDMQSIKDLSDFVNGLGDLLFSIHMYEGILGEFSFSNLVEQLQDIIDLSSPENTEDISVMTDLMNSVAAASEQLRHFSSIDSIYDVLEEIMYDTKLLTQMKTTGEALSKMLADGIDDGTSFELVSNAMKSLLGKLSTNMAETLFMDTLSLNELLASAFGDAEDADISSIIDVLDSKVTEAGENEEWSFRDVGFYLAAGIAVGVSSGTYLIENACRAAVAAARIAAMDEAGEASPSKVFAVIGGYMSEGMAIGISDQQGTVENSMTGLVDSAIDGATEAIATFTALMGQEIDSNPVITPVLDLSNVTAGAGFIDGVLSGARNINLNSGAVSEYAQTTVPRSGRSTGEYQGTDLSGINSRLNSLSAQLNNLGNQIGNLQIVMDSGAVVGSISPGVSRSIGQKSTYNRRHNA